VTHRQTDLTKIEINT